jgi:hypothetical protein
MIMKVSLLHPIKRQTKGLNSIGPGGTSLDFRHCACDVGKDKFLAQRIQQSRLG